MLLPRRVQNMYVSHVRKRIGGGWVGGRVGGEGTCAAAQQQQCREAKIAPAGVMLHVGVFGGRRRLGSSCYNRSRALSLRCV